MFFGVKNVFLLYNVAMEIKIIAAVVSVLAVAAFAVSVPFRIRMFVRKYGSPVRKAVPGKQKTAPVVLVLCAAVSAAAWFAPVSAVMSVVICLCGIIGAEISSAELVRSGVCGVYGKCVAAPGGTVLYSDIVNFPPSDSSSVLFVVTSGHGQVGLSFASADECSSVLSEILRIRPELASE